MGELHVLFPTEETWRRQAPPWATDLRAELLADLERAASGVTTSRRGGASSGASAAETALASRFEQWKNRGRTASLFPG
jgi:hypothetical protein